MGKASTTELYKGVSRYYEQILEAAPHKPSKLDKQNTQVIAEEVKTNT